MRCSPGDAGNDGLDHSLEPGVGRQMTPSPDPGMEQVFAPWRIDWVERDTGTHEGCVFCALPEESDDRQNYLVARGDQAYVLLNNYPYNPGHAMVVPYQHATDHRGFDEAVLTGKERLVARTLEAMDAALEPDGYNVGYNLGTGAAGGSVEHLHTHVVPRWAGDTNFMPVIGETSVIVEAVLDTYDRLHAAFAEQAAAAAGSDKSAVVVEAD